MIHEYPFTACKQDWEEAEGGVCKSCTRLQSKRDDVTIILLSLCLPRVPAP